MLCYARFLAEVLSFCSALMNIQPISGGQMTCLICLTNDLQTE